MSGPSARFLLAFSLILAAGVHLAAERVLTRGAATRFQRKLQTVVRNSETRAGGPRLIPVTESEVNSYLSFLAGDQIPVGLTEPYIRIVGNRRLAGRAIVDLDTVRRKQSSGSWLDIRSYLTGQLPVTASGRLHTKNGVGRFELESAAISGIPVSKTLMQELLTFYSRTPEHPQGVSLDDPFKLPAQIREIRVGKGQAVIVQ
ncbi:MAG: hypothetical protein HYX76_09360 [Acidobacteria bacterium]|nr:hypothetical protein [Acidobacteriota bacterium]